MAKLLKGYVVIPGFSKYAINENGEGSIIETRKAIPWHKSNGYVFTVLRNDLGKRVSVGQHTLKALAFIPKPDMNKKYIINHRDGNRRNNDLSNLEWVTYSGNNLHAYTSGLRKDSVRVTAKVLSTGEIIKFNSISSCARHFKWMRTYITYKDYPLIYRGVELTFFKEEGALIAGELSFPGGICARSIVTKEIIISESPGQLGPIIKVCPKIIGKILRCFKFQYPINGYDIRVLDGNIKWPEYSEDEIEAFKNIKFIHQPVWISDQNGYNKLVGSVLAASNITKTHERSIRYSMSNNTVCANGYRYTKYNRKFEVNT